MSELYYGDNLDVLRGHVEDASVDLVYLDPPFNSNASYNILFKSRSGNGADASIEAFDDTWQWGPAAARALTEITQSGDHGLHKLMYAMKAAIGENAMMAYLAMMTVRLVELRRVLKATGSLYLHCDPTASHYLKVMLDAVFGGQNFSAEIIWRRTTARVASRRFPRLHDTILHYAKDATQVVFNPQKIPLNAAWIESAYRKEDECGKYTLDNLTAAGTRNGPSGLPWRGHDPAKVGIGRHWRYHPDTLDRLDREGRIFWPPSGKFPQIKQYLSECSGTSIGDLWTDEAVKLLARSSDERLGYPTQKPRALLERIIAASSNPGDVVLDPFCGCGTAVDAAQKLGRRWIGIDVTHLAVGLIEKRLREGYGERARFETIGVPNDRDSALRLAAENPHEFQNWFCLKVGGYPLDGGRKGADRGVDGHLYPYETASTTATGVISVKAGQNIGVAMIRDLRGVMKREGYPFGLLLSAHEPTKPMRAEAVAAGLHATQFGTFPRLQILTPADLFHGSGAKLPPLAPINRRAARVETRASHKPGAQGTLV